MTDSAADDRPPMPGNMPLGTGPPPGGPAAASGGGSGGLGYHVDMENAPQVVANLREAADRLNLPIQELRRKAVNIPAPGRDEVSLAAARNLNRMGRDCLAALTGLQQWCIENADRLSQDLATYHNVEVENLRLPPAAPW